MRPPKIAEHLVHWLCSHGQHADIPSDMEEEFDRNLVLRGAVRAKIQYIWTAICLLRPFILRDKFMDQSKEASLAIIKSSLTTFRRNAYREKVNFTINFVGLSVAITSFILILNYTSYELSYDGFQRKGDSIYRVTYSKKKNGELSFNTTLAYSGIAQPFKDRYEEIVDFVRIRPVNVINDQTIVKTDNGSFEENRVHFTEPSFFSIFSFKLLDGNPQTCLKEPFTAVISRSTSQKYFGLSDPIGKTLTIREDEHFTITGLIEDAPENSQIQYHVLLSHASLDDILHPDWTEEDVYSFHGQLFLETIKGANIKAIRATLPKFVDEVIWSRQERAIDVDLELAIMPLRDIHLKSQFQHEMEHTSNFEMIILLSCVALLILILAWINHINLVSTRTRERLKELGIRTILGSKRSLFLKQSILESVLINSLALIMAVGLVLLITPWLVDLEVYGSFVIDPFRNPLVWIILFPALALGTVISGCFTYYNLVKSGELSEVRCSGFITKGSKTGTKLKGGLIIFQFTICVMLLIGTGVTYRQLSFLRNAELGITTDKTLVIKAPSNPNENFVHQSSQFRAALLQHESIIDFSYTSDRLGSEITRSTWYQEVDKPQKGSQYSYRSYIDEHFVPSLDIELLAGRNFNEGDTIRIAPRTNSKESHTFSPEKVIINEALMKGLGYEDPARILNRVITYKGSINPNERFIIIGVTKDYNHLSAKNHSIPQLFLYWPYPSNTFMVRISPKIHDTEKLVDLVYDIEGAFKKYYDEEPFQASFLDSEFEKLYQIERRMRDLFALFSPLAILVACLGLLGLALHNTIQRSKEFSIRRVMGSSRWQIGLSLIKSYLKLILVANVIAWPLSHYLLGLWLKSSSENHVQIDWWLFPSVLAIIAFLGLVTVSVSVTKAALISPLNVLRRE